MGRIIVAHPGKQHSYRLASALKKAGLLQLYVTTIYRREKPSLMMRTIAPILSADNAKRANGRRNEDLGDQEVVQYNELGGLIEALLTRIDSNRKIYSFVRKKNADHFGVRTAKLAIKNNAEAVVMYDTNAETGFAYLKHHAPHIKRVLDVSSAAAPYRKLIYEKEIERSGRKDLIHEDAELWDTRRLNGQQREIDLSQYFLAASPFVRDSLIACGAKEDQIKIVPYGKNTESEICRKKAQAGGRIHFLFVGQVSSRKGVPILLEAMSALPVEAADLTLTGSCNPNACFVRARQEAPNITFTGSVTFDRMKEIYESADVFVFPTLAEGMAQVCLEAMGCGLPIITTPNSGVSELIEEGRNGFLIPCSNPKQLEERMRWFVEHSERIPEMGRQARESVKPYTWDAYEKKMTDAMMEILSE